MSKGSSARYSAVFESEWFESEENINEHESLKEVLLNLLQKSSVYAVSQLVTSNGLGRKILWFLVLLIGLSGCSYEIYHFLTLYFQYPVVITLQVKNNWKLDFPAVTVCNLNRIPYSNYLYLLHDVLPDGSNASKKARPIITERKKFASCTKDFDGTFSDERSQILTFLNKYLQNNETIRSKYGYRKIEMLSSCTFNAETCSLSNFTEFTSIQFGNCFTFNGMHNKQEQSLQTPYVGPNSGLEISISLDSISYPPITSSIGARVIIHEYDVEPNPEDNGINISPGYETSIAIQQTSIYRLPHPYRDKCKEYKGEKLSERSQASCITNCMQNENFIQCGCVDPFLSTESSMPLCDLRNQTTVCCLDDVMKQLNEENVSCSCPLPCKTTDYEMTISTAEWPSRRFFKEFLKDEFKLRRRLKHAKKKTGEKFAFNETDLNNTSIYKEKKYDMELFKDHRQEVAKLKVFYKSLEKISYRQEPMFQDSELFSQLGGQLGLWLGISLVALFECIENVTHLIHYFFKRMSKPKQVTTDLFRNNQSKEISRL